MIKQYEKDGKKLYEVYVAERDAEKKILARRKRGITSERQAKDIEFKFKTELKNLASAKKTMTWAHWHEEFLKDKKRSAKQSTLANYDGVLKGWIPESWGPKDLSAFTSDDVYELIDKVGEKMSPITQKNIHKMVRRIFERAVEKGIITINPAKGMVMKVPRVNQLVLNVEEADLLLTNAKITGHRFYPVWAFALMTGMRSGEMYALKWSDIDFVTGNISVTKQWTSKDGVTEPKNREHRKVPISKSLEAFLMELRNGTPVEGGHVLPRLGEWERGEQAKVLKAFCKIIGITEIKFHDLRATFITNMLSQGVPLAQVMSIVGHRHTDTTDIYLRLAGVNVRGATEALGYKLPTNADLSNVVALR